MLPAARVRRASFLPREVRTSAATVICSLKFVSPVSGLRSPIRSRTGRGTLWVRLSKANVGSKTPVNLYTKQLAGGTGREARPTGQLHKQSTHRSLLVDRPYGVCHQPRARQRHDS